MLYSQYGSGVRVIVGRGVGFAVAVTVGEGVRVSVAVGIGVDVTDKLLPQADRKHTKSTITINKSVYFIGT